MSTRNPPEECVVEIQCDAIPLRMIERIEEFRADLHAQPLGDLRVLRKGQVKVCQPGQADWRPRGISECPARRLLKGGGVESLSQGLGTAVGLPDNIGSLRPSASDSGVIAGQDRPARTSALEGDNPG